MSSGILSQLSGQSPLLTAAGLAAAFLLGRFFLTWLNEERKIRKLGGHAPFVPDWSPLGLGFTYRAIRANLTNRNYEFWLSDVFKNANPNRPYTAELRVLGQRSVLTADEENIKAILATQFSDYGKGERFRKDWHEFLGESKKHGYLRPEQPLTYQ